MGKELTIQEQRELLANPIIQEVKKFEIQQRMAQMFATSTIVPDTYRKNLGNCVIAIDMAMRMGTNPLATMQNLYIVHGVPAWSTKFLVACINRCGRFTELDYEKVGDDASKKNYKCRAFAYAKNDIKKEHPLYGAWITWPMVEGEGWSKKAGSKWLTMPELMFMYRAAAFWSRTYAPEISMGFPTQEEAMDGAVIDVDVEDIKVPETPETEQPGTAGGNNDGVVDQETGEVKEQPANPADAIKQAIKKQQRANQQDDEQADDTAMPHQEGSLFDQQ